MASPDPIAVERQMYLDMLEWETDDPTYSMGDLRNMTGGGANAHRAAKSSTVEGRNGGNPFVTTETFNSYRTDVNVKADFGAVGDGVADDTLAIQAALDYGLATKRSIYLPPGTYKISNTLHLGSSTSYSSTRLYGDMAPVLGEPAMAGPTIVATMTDRPAINFRRGRGSTLRGVCIQGQLRSWIDANNLAGIIPAYGGSDALIDDTLASSWVDPSHSPSGDGRYTPYAAITVDGFAGSVPPGGGYPADSGAYGQSPSSVTRIENVWISGFNTGISIQPCDYDGNGDYVKVHDATIEYCKWGISVGQSQSRNVDIRNIKLYKVFTCLTNRTHGKQTGRFGGTIDSVSPSNVIYLVNWDTAQASPTKITHLTAELTWSIGLVTCTGGSDTPLVFEQCVFMLDLHSPHRGIPAWGIETLGDLAGSILFKGCTVAGFYRVFPVGTSYFQALDGTAFFASDTRGVSTMPGSSIVRRLAYNTLAGGLITARGVPRRSQSIKHRACHLDTGAFTSAIAERGSYDLSGRNYCIPAFLRDAVPKEQAYYPLNLPFRSFSFNKATNTSTLLNKTLTLDMGARPESLFALSGPLPGDVMLDATSGSVFFVTARTGAIVTAELVNNFRSLDAGATYTTINPYVGNTGTMYIVVGRYYLPSYDTVSTLTTGSPTVTAVGRDDGYSTYLATDIVVNDWLSVSEMHDKWISPTGSTSKITAVDGGAGTITLTGNALKTRTGLLPILVRQAPPNE